MLLTSGRMPRPTKILRRIVSRLLRQRGWELKPIGAPIRGYGNFLDMLKRRGFHPATVIDIGVANGTPWLYGRFPDAKLVAIEPNPHFDGALEHLTQRWHADVYRCAVGAGTSEVVLHEDQLSQSSSTLQQLDVAFSHARDARSRQGRTFTDVRVPLRTLDDVLDDRYQAPYLLKIDTEGFELDVLAGAARTLEKTAVVIIEASVALRFTDGYSFADLVRTMDAQGFRLFDILHIKPQAPDGPINYMDAAFVHRDWEGLLGAW